MEKAIVKRGFVGFIVITTIGLGIKHQQKETTLSDLALANVEALATGETVKLPCEYDEDKTCKVTFQLKSGETSEQKVPQSKNI